MSRNLCPPTAPVGSTVWGGAVGCTGQEGKYPFPRAHARRFAALQVSAAAPQVTTFVHSILHELHTEENPKSHGPALEAHGLMHPVRGPRARERGTQQRQRSARPLHLTTTLYELIATIQEVGGTDDDALVVATVFTLLRFGRLTWLGRTSAPLGQPQHTAIVSPRHRPDAPHTGPRQAINTPQREGDNHAHA